MPAVGMGLPARVSSKGGTRRHGAQHRVLSLIGVALVGVAFVGTGWSLPTLVAQSCRPAAALRGSAVDFGSFPVPASVRKIRHDQRRESLARRAGERAAYIAVVDVDVKPGSEESFLEASLQNARESVKEQDNQRFDVLQSVDEPNRFALVEIYRKSQGPVDHKSTAHYAKWRDDVADLMATPRSASQWDTVVPRFASGFAPEALLLERFPPSVFSVSHEQLQVLPGKESEFVDLTTPYLTESMRDDESMRVDLLRGAEDATRFLLIRVYQSDSAVASHMKKANYLRWKVNVAPLLAEPSSTKRFENRFPSVPRAWQASGDLAQAGGKTWAR